MINHKIISFSAVQICDLSYIHLHTWFCHVMNLDQLHAVATRIFLLFILHFQFSTVCSQTFHHFELLNYFCEEFYPAGLATVHKFIFLCTVVVIFFVLGYFVFFSWITHTQSHTHFILILTLTCTMINPVPLSCEVIICSAYLHTYYKQWYQSLIQNCSCDLSSDTRSLLRELRMSL